MPRMLSLVLLGACSFRPGGSAAPGDGGRADAGAADAAQDGQGPADAILPLDAPAFVLCDPADLALRACYTFDGTTLDGSSYGNDATATGVTFAAGHDGQAAVTTASTMTVAATTTLDLTSMTLKMWIRASSLPATGQRYGLLDSAGRYRIFIQPGGAIRCTTSGGPDLTTAAGVIPVGTWVRVACTYDQQNLRIYVDGVMIDSQASTAAIPATGGDLVIGQNSPSGDNFDGAIDDLQVWGSIVAP